jgi:hypothetical protein
MRYLVPVAADFQITKVQIGFFTPSLPLQTNPILGRLLDRFGGLFDDDPIVFPLPSDAPAEIPRIILRARSGELELRVSFTRADVVNNQMVWGVPLDPAQHVQTSMDVWRAIEEVSARPVVRAAFVLNRAIVQADPAGTLARHFCQGRWYDREHYTPLNGAKTFELHSHKVYPFTDARILVNSWVRCKTQQVRVSLPGEEPVRAEPAIVVEQDINTVPTAEAAEGLDTDLVERLLRAVPNEADHITTLYFPPSAELP